MTSKAIWKLALPVTFVAALGLSAANAQPIECDLRSDQAALGAKASPEARAEAEGRPGARIETAEAAQAAGASATPYDYGCPIVELGGEKATLKPERQE